MFDDLKMFKTENNISSGKLRRGGMRDQIGVNISSMCHNGYRGRIFGSVEDAFGNLFA